MARRGDTFMSSHNMSSLILLATLAALTMNVDFAVATDALPHLCDNVRCPPLEDITCPADSDIRESIMPIAAALMQPLNPDDDVDAPAVPPHIEPTYNSSEIIDEELYTHCCVAQKCLCRTCFIPDCHEEHEVVYELTPESMDTPGKCCGTYECRPEPNCNAVRNTESYWMTNCQRCKCFSGERICHQSCDEGFKGSMAICNSKSLNRFFRHGESWKDGCYECDCVNGEEKCVMSFCRSVNCPPSRQVMLKDSCCPICWPANITMPNAEDAEYSEEPMTIDNGIYDDEDENDAEEEEGSVHGSAVDAVAAETDEELDLLPNLVLNSEEMDVAATATTTTAITDNTTAKATASAANIAVFSNKTTAASSILNSTMNSSSTTTTITTTVVPFVAIIATTEAPTTAPLTTAAPCDHQNRHDAPATFQVYPEVVEVIRQMHHNDLLYAIIGCLVLAVVLLVAWNIHLRAKQRSYRPVSIIDDNFNKMSANMKKVNEYV